MAAFAEDAAQDLGDGEHELAVGDFVADGVGDPLANGAGAALVAGEGWRRETVGWRLEAGAK